MKIVIALGGNALLSKNEKLEADILMKNIKMAAIMLAKIIKQHQVRGCLEIVYYLIISY
ncbi:MAG: hypothetical protein JWM09_1418 [Francisellaceae bacterium]|nr:hypothetical protein [Francisellaceae bacterium]